MTWDRQALEGAFIDACALELQALKPGNVHVHADGHGMTVDQFVRSAHVAAAPLCAPGRPVGLRIRDAVAATIAEVGCNTNLGIVLLAAPLLAAAEAHPSAGLREGVAAVLAALTIGDAEAAYEAIRLARPAGLGSVAAEDVASAPTVTLRQAMALAASRDRVARQYTEDYEDVFDVGAACFEHARRSGMDRAAAATRTYLTFLSGVPDSHVARKHGAEIAEAVRREAAALRPWADMPALLRFDEDLKKRGLNPGTSADLTVVSLLAAALSRRL